jgi:hypothetical protein
MGAVLVRHGYIRPQRSELLVDLSHRLPPGARLEAWSAGLYPGSDLVLRFDWIEQSTAFVIAAETLRAEAPHYVALRLEGEKMLATLTLLRLALCQ